MPDPPQRPPRRIAAAPELTLPAGKSQAWVGCEAGSMREIRAHMLGEQQLSPNHDTGEDDE